MFFFKDWVVKKLKCNCLISTPVSSEAWANVRHSSLCRNFIWVPTPGCEQHIPVIHAGAQSMLPTSPRAAFPASQGSCILLSLPGGDCHMHFWNLPPDSTATNPKFTVQCLELLRLEKIIKSSLWIASQRAWWSGYHLSSQNRLCKVT